MKNNKIILGEQTEFFKRGMSFEDVKTTFALVRLAGKQNTCVNNGDNHRLNPDPSDKNKNAALWEAALRHTNEMLVRVVSKYGFKVKYDGIFPSFEIDGRTVFAETN